MSKQNHKVYDAVFFSPHLDDAIFSCGGLINQLSQKKDKIAIVNIFTKAQDYKIQTEAIKNELKKAAYQSAKQMFLTRKKHEKNIANKLKIDVFCLDFIDGLFRKNQKDQFIYDSYQRLFSGVISQDDQLLIKKIQEKIFSFIINQTNKKTDLYLPIGHGGHVDHLIINHVFKNFNKNHTNNLFFWHDIPYANNINHLIKLEKPKKIISLNNNQAKQKKLLCQEYKKQYQDAEKTAFSTINFYQEILF
ncbi:MAG: PIG-L family deacetylase [Patescibacteria group bacterium]